MSFPNDRTYTPDINLFFSDNAAAYTASGYLQVGGANALIDLGGNQGTSPVQQARIDAVAVVDVTAIKTSSSNETYKLLVVVSNDPSFGVVTANSVVCAGGIELGYQGSTDVVNGATSVTGRYEVMFSTNIAGSLYEYAAVYLVTGGTNPSINIDGFFAVLPHI
jgi:hypothetical protein